MKKIKWISYFIIFILMTLSSCTQNNLSSNTASDIENKAESSINSDDQTFSFTPLSTTLASGQKFNYFLYTPKNSTENMPLILYLHGGSGKPESENGNLDLLVAGDGLPKYVKDGVISPECFIVFPQLPYGKKGWSDVSKDLLAFLNTVSTELNCNKNKISITGHSMGGKGTWDIALSYPDTFYKIAPLSGSITLSNVNLNKLKNKPVWAIVGADDQTVDPQSSIDFIDALQKTNNQAKITVIENYDHFDVPKAYISDEYNLLAWLIK